MIPLAMGQSAQQIPQPQKYRVVVLDLYDTEQDVWPSDFNHAPQEGEQIMSESGRTLTVLNVVHAMMNGYPVTYLEVGVDTRKVTPTSGAGGSLE